MSTQSNQAKSFNAVCWRDAEEHLGLQVLSSNFSEMDQRLLVLVTERGRDLLLDHLALRNIEMYAADVSTTRWDEAVLGQMMLRHADLFPLLCTYASWREYHGVIVKKDSKTPSYYLLKEKAYFDNYKELAKGKDDYLVYERTQGTRQFTVVSNY